jgi:hypothetical protein
LPSNSETITLKFLSILYLFSKVDTRPANKLAASVMAFSKASTSALV